MKYLIASLVLLLQALQGFSQPILDWVRTYNGPSNLFDIPYDLAVSNDNFIYVTGYSINSITGADYCTIKYDENGILQWFKIFNGPANQDDAALKVLAYSNNNIYVGGESWGGNSTKLDIAVIKYNNSGNELWQRRYNGTLNDWDDFYDMALDSNGKIYVTGYTTVFNGGGGYLWDCITIKYDSAGNQIWAKKYNGPDNRNDVGFKICVDNEGKILVGGSTFSKLMLIKYDTSGSVIWDRIFIDSNSSFYWTKAMALDKGSNIIIAGVSYDPVTYDDYLTVKYDKNGNLKWVRRFSSPNADDDWPWDICSDYYSNIFVTGNGGEFYNSDFMTVKYDSNGNFEWVRYYNNVLNSEDRALNIEFYQNYTYVSGYSYNSLYWPYITTIKYDENGNQIWLKKYEPNSNMSAMPYALRFDNMGNFFICGPLGYSAETYDYLTIKYAQPIGIQPISSEIPDKFILYQNYPNPFNPVTKIRFSQPPVGAQYIETIQLIVYDILGREVKTLVNEQLKPGTYEVQFDGTDLTSGVYYYKVSAGQFSQTRKMILVK